MTIIENNILLVKTAFKASDIVSWLTKKNWKFELELVENDPFGSYRFRIPDNSHRFMTALTWGLDAE